MHCHPLWFLPHSVNKLQTWWEIYVAPSSADFLRQQFVKTHMQSTAATLPEWHYSCFISAEDAGCACVCVFGWVCVRVCLSVCVCERERERERERATLTEIQFVTKTKHVMQSILAVSEESKRVVEGVPYALCCQSDHSFRWKQKKIRLAK
jgi:hypothetical protein